jgi:hypothetical protein
MLYALRVITIVVLLQTAAAQQPETALMNSPETTPPDAQTGDKEVPVFTVDSISRPFKLDPPDPGSVGVAGFRGSIPSMFYLSDQNNDSLTNAVLADFGIADIGWNSLLAPKTLVIRMRSNTDYALSVQAFGIPDGPDCAPGPAPREISTCDIGFGVRRIANASGSVVRPRNDTVPEKFSIAKWSNVSGANGNDPPFRATLHDISAVDTPILSGTRISASGDNSSVDNFIEVELGLTLRPQFLTPGPFSGALTLTVAPQRP